MAEHGEQKNQQHAPSTADEEPSHDSKQEQGTANAVVPPKKPPASKVFCDEDEIALLKGLSVFWVNGRNSKWAEFHRFIVDELSNDQFSRVQVSEKIRALKKKFETNSERARANGGRLDFSDAHASVVFELSKALWGDEKGIVQETRKMAEEEANKTPRKQKQKQKQVDQVDEHDEENKKRRKGKQVDEHDENKKISKQGKQVDEHDEEKNVQEKRKQVIEIGNEDFPSAFPLLYSSFEAFNFPLIAKEKCVLIARDNAQELEEKWRELNAEAHRLELKKIDLIKRDLQGHLQRK